MKGINFKKKVSDFDFCSSVIQEALSCAHLIDLQNGCARLWCVALGPYSRCTLSDQIIQESEV
jgi:hypothetical protein